MSCRQIGSMAKELHMLNFLSPGFVNSVLDLVKESLISYMLPRERGNLLCCVYHTDPVRQLITEGGW
jgi:hypothetical protein